MGSTAYEQSGTAASNTSVGGVSIAEGMSPSGVNDGMRAMIAQYYQLAVATSVAGTDTYTATLTPTPAAYVDGMRIPVRFANANTSATPTLNLNSLGARTITKNGSTALAAGDIAAGAALVVEYVSASSTFQLVASAQGVQSLAGTTNSGISLSGSTGAVQIGRNPATLLTKSPPVVGDSFLIMDSAGGNAEKTSLVSGLIASAATALTGTEAVQWLTPNAFAGNKSLNATNGYYQFPGGLTINWLVQSIANNSSITWTFAKAFPTVCVWAGGFAQQSGGVGGAVGVTSYSTTSVVVWNPSTNTLTHNLLAIGY